jgi:tRNA threonylcarbamoyladenosine biosynthesis protein TsaE
VEPKNRKTVEITIHSKEEMAQVAAQLLEAAGDRRKFAFYGEIGAGKTTLIQTLCRLLEVADYVTSPTFALVNVYESPEGPVYHLDLYRLKNVEEALDIGIEEYLADDAYCFIEWPELVDALLPEDVIRIKITFLAESSRKILFL